MNTYDFDKTIFYPDSSAAFYCFCFRRFPRAVWKSVPRSLVMTIGYAFKKLDAKALKQQLFSFLPDIADIDSAVLDFWSKNRRRIGEWYLRQKRDDDVIISASPEFLLKPVCDELGVALIGTRMDKNTGRIIGLNCHDSEKVSRFLTAFPDGHTEAFYSDSLSDTPMAELADSAFMVKKNRVMPWPEK